MFIMFIEFGSFVDFASCLIVPFSLLFGYCAIGILIYTIITTFSNDPYAGPAAWLLSIFWGVYVCGIPFIPVFALLYGFYRLVLWISISIRTKINKSKWKKQNEYIQVHADDLRKGIIKEIPY